MTFALQRAARAFSAARGCGRRSRGSARASPSIHLSRLSSPLSSPSSSAIRTRSTTMSLTLNSRASALSARDQIFVHRGTVAPSVPGARRQSRTRSGAPYARRASGTSPWKFSRIASEPAVGDRGAVQRVRRVEVLALAAVADPGAARLEVGRVRARRQLAVALLRREPRLDVVALRRRGREIAGGAVDDAIRHADFLHERLLDREHPLVLVP